MMQMLVVSLTDEQRETRSIIENHNSQLESLAAARGMTASRKRWAAIAIIVFLFIIMIGSITHGIAFNTVSRIM
jgi:hypothetical protein